VIWRIGAIVTAALIALPLLGLASSLLVARGEMWRHLAETQLRDIIANTALLLLGVGVGTGGTPVALLLAYTVRRSP
jgi:iron(III) transport system permease protein